MMSYVLSYDPYSDLYDLIMLVYNGLFSGTRNGSIATLKERDQMISEH